MPFQGLDTHGGRNLVLKAQLDTALHAR
jgi:hypothetical protein